MVDSFRRSNCTFGSCVDIVSTNLRLAIKSMHPFFYGHLFRSACSLLLLLLLSAQLNDVNSTQYLNALAEKHDISPLFDLVLRIVTAIGATCCVSAASQFIVFSPNFYCSLSLSLWCFNYNSLKCSGILLILFAFDFNFCNDWMRSAPLWTRAGVRWK